MHVRLIICITHVFKWIVPAFISKTTLMMNFDGLDPGLGEYAAGLHGGLEPGLDTTLDPALLQAVELDPDAMAVPVVEGMYSELHSVASEVGVPVTATHFDLHEELLWIGNHRVTDISAELLSCTSGTQQICFGPKVLHKPRLKKSKLTKHISYCYTFHTYFISISSIISKAVT